MLTKLTPILCLIALPLIGCTQLSAGEMHKAKADCMEKGFETQYNLYKCITDSHRVLLQSSNSSNMDLFEMGAKKRLALASKVDAGKMTKAEFASEYAEYSAKLHKETAARSSAGEWDIAKGAIDRMHETNKETKRNMERFNDARRWRY